MGSCNCGAVNQISASDEACVESCEQCSCVNTPTPYYNQGTPLQEEHCVARTVQRYVTSLSASNSFAIPNCNSRAVITFPGLVQMLVGSYLWNPLYGFLRVTAVDSSTGQVTVTNDCIVYNAAAGTVVPRCTLWNVTTPPLGSSGCIIVMPPCPPPYPAGNPFALDVDSIVGNVVTLRWHSVTVIP